MDGLHTAPRVDSQTDRLVFDLRNRILHGEFVGGERLTELGLVPLLGASRTPIRIALERLSHEGLLDALPTGGFRVRSFTVAEALDTIEIRGVLEGTAARFAAERLTSVAELAELKLRLADAILHPPVTMDSFARYLEHNDRFPSRVLAAVQEPFALACPGGGCQAPVCGSQLPGVHRRQSGPEHRFCRGRAPPFDCRRDRTSRRLTCRGHCTRACADCALESAEGTRAGRGDEPAAWCGAYHNVDRPRGEPGSLRGSTPSPTARRHWMPAMSQAPRSYVVESVVNASHILEAFTSTAEVLSTARHRRATRAQQGSVFPPPAHTPLSAALLRRPM